MILWCVFLFCGATIPGINANSSIGGGQRIRKTAQMKEELKKADILRDNVWGSSNLYEDSEMWPVLIFHGYFNNTKVVKVNFFYLSAFCKFVLYLCFLSYFLLGDNTGFQDNISNYFIHTYIMLICEGSWPHLCTGWCQRACNMDGLE